MHDKVQNTPLVEFICFFYNQHFYNQHQAGDKSGKS